MTHVLEALKLRDVVLRHRIAMPAMCQYSARDGMPSDWHLVHYGTRAVGGFALINLEATAVAPEGRITPYDLGLWHDGQVAPLARIAQLIRAQGAVAGVQLAHAGRKGGIAAGWEAQRSLTADEGGWTTCAPSALAYGEGYASPTALMADEIAAIVGQFVAAARRACAAGFQTVEIHAAHGYLLHQFLSPLANQRNDAYGGSFENRTRLVREVVAAVRAEWPERLPLLVRISATDWVDGGWCVEESVELCRILKTLGVDLIDVSSGGLIPTATMPVGPGFQTGFAERIRREAGIPTATVGLITTPAQADHIVRTGQADLVMIGREALRNPYWPMQAVQALGGIGEWPRQYLRAAPLGTVSRQLIQEKA
ncbi:NADH:flavin oxidoreductase/NADH oxidase [Propionivibrio dicarboxylicus]|uniref:2,4-dienoyl-CoA reductase n=1 Tax=Propionivibrio dicarboxylicus TaxID=83767 RepID=A0A1G7WS18_9RHOO|nr:NADH:flavin oxidoreductase/NADH oxidase [Propionivibrio dicarboxylicus]SDG74694.1 2,4-dienoyl-CoA reductase [Propionivibrio dicarboxylicus]